MEVQPVFFLGKGPDMNRRKFVAVGTGVSAALIADRASALPFVYSKVSHEICISKPDLDPASRIIKTLETLEFIHHGSPVTQLSHALQAGTRARRAGMDR